MAPSALKVLKQTFVRSRRHAASFIWHLGPAKSYYTVAPVCLLLFLSKTRKPLSAKTKDLMQVPPLVVRGDVTIDEAAAMMWESNMGSVIVVDDEGKMAGILTERDVLFAVTKSLIGKGVPVSGIMSKTSIKASPNESIITAVNRMTKSGVRHLPVVDRSGRPVGMISMRDAMGISEPLLRFVLRPSSRGRT
jgi:CBS domain-containing protein